MESPTAQLHGVMTIVCTPGATGFQATANMPAPGVQNLATGSGHREGGLGDLGWNERQYGGDDGGRGGSHAMILLSVRILAL